MYPMTQGIDFVQGSEFAVGSHSGWSSASNCDLLSMRFSIGFSLAPHLFPPVRRGLQYRSLVESEQPAVRQQGPAGTPGMADLRRLRRINQVGADVVQRAGVQPSEIDRGQVGVFSRFQAAGFPLDSQRPGAIDRGHFQYRRRRQGSGVIRHEFAEQGGAAHFADHVEIVVAGPPSAPSATLDAGFEQTADAAGAAGEFHVGFRAVNNRCARRGEHRIFLVDQLRGVHALEARSDQPEFLKPGERPPPVLAYRIFDFRRGLVDMYVNRRAERFGLFRSRAQLRVRHGVWRMGAISDVNSRMFAEALTQFPRLAQIFFGSVGPDRWKIQNGAAKLGAHAGVDYALGHHIGEKIHVGETGRAPRIISAMASLRRSRRKSGPIRRFSQRPDMLSSQLLQGNVVG